MKREYNVKIHRREYAVGFFYVLDGAKTKGRSKKLDPMCHGGRKLAFLFRKYLHTSTWSDRLSVRDQQKKKITTRKNTCLGIQSKVNLPSGNMIFAMFFLPAMPLSYYL